jgi:hypothetical protein
MIDKFLLLTWRVWHARNEATHDKPLPTVEGSASFLCGYLKLLQNIKTTPTDQILHGKQPMIDASDVRAASQAKLPPDKSWRRPPAGWVTLTIDGSFKEVDGNGGSGMVLRDEVGHIIFSACHFLPSCVEAMEAEL